jgi:hypothetical protein
LCQSGAEVFSYQFIGSLKLFFADPKLALTQLGAIVLAGEPDERRIAIRPNSGQNLPHSIFDILQVVLCPLVE